MLSQPISQQTSTATTNSTSQITVNWTDATGEQVPAGYLQKPPLERQQLRLMVIAETAGTLVQIVVQGAETAVFTGLKCFQTT